MKSLVIAFGAAIMLILLPVLFVQLVDAQTSDYELSFAGVTTGADEYTSNVTLTEELYEDSVISVSAITSNTSADSPTAGGYNAVTQLLTINGLTEDTVRTVEVTYDIEDPTLPDGFVAAFVITIWFLWLVCIGLLVGSIYAFFQS